MKRKQNKTNIIIFLTVFIVSILMAPYFLSNEQPFRNPTTGAATSPHGTVSLNIPSSICQVELKNKYWNYISLCSDPADKSISSLLNGIDYRFIMTWDNSNQEWLMYSPQADSNPFNTLESNKSYFIYLNEGSANMSVLGEPTNNMNISMGEYWNAPSWPYNFNSTIIKEIETITETFKYEMKWNGTSQQLEMYSPQAETKPFNNINKGEGKLIYSTSENTIRYNKSNLQT